MLCLLWYKWSPEKKFLIINFNLKCTALNFIINDPIASEVTDPDALQRIAHKKPFNRLNKNFVKSLKR